MNKLNEPFDITITINFSGLTKSDGVATLTPAMLIDKMTAPFDEALYKKLIRDYEIKVKINNIKDAKTILAKSKKEN